MEDNYVLGDHSFSKSNTGDYSRWASEFNSLFPHLLQDGCRRMEQILACLGNRFPHPDLLLGDDHNKVAIEYYGAER